MIEIFFPAMASLGVGIALGSAPGPVQAVLLAETVRGGIGRGLRAMAGANVTFGLLLVGLALGLSVVPPNGPALRLLKMAGGALLLWLAADGLRSSPPAGGASTERRALPPVVRGSLAVLLNPGAWLFLGTTGSSLLSTAGQRGSTGGAILTALALVVGVAIGDGVVVLVGGMGIRRAGDRVGVWVRRILACFLAALGVWLLADGMIR